MPEFREALLAVVEETRQPDLFALEMALDRAYFKKLAWLTRRMKGWTRRLVSFDVDSHGLLLLLRARFNYDRSFDDVKPFLASYPPSFRPYSALGWMPQAPEARMPWSIETKKASGSLPANHWPVVL